MTKTILIAFVFLLLNFTLIQIHFWIFRSGIPFLGWGSAIIHVFLLIILPYKKLLK